MHWKSWSLQSLVSQDDVCGKYCEKKQFAWFIVIYPFKCSSFTQKAALNRSYAKVWELIAQQGWGYFSARLTQNSFSAHLCLCTVCSYASLSDCMSLTWPKFTWKYMRFILAGLLHGSIYITFVCLNVGSLSLSSCFLVLPQPDPKLGGLLSGGFL